MATLYTISQRLDTYTMKLLRLCPTRLCKYSVPFGLIVCVNPLEPVDHGMFPSHVAGGTEVVVVAIGALPQHAIYVLEAPVARHAWMLQA